MMKHYTYTSKPQGITSLKLIGGGKFSCSALLRHSLIPHFILIIVSFLCFACSTETSISNYPEMQAYYVESCHLGVATTDSIRHFSQKVDVFVTSHADAVEDPLYPKIKENIRAVSFRLSITIDEEWDGEYNMNF